LKGVTYQKKWWLDSAVPGLPTSEYDVSQWGIHLLGGGLYKGGEEWRSETCEGDAGIYMRNNRSQAGGPLSKGARRKAKKGRGMIVYVPRPREFLAVFGEKRGKLEGKACSC